MQMTPSFTSLLASVQKHLNVTTIQAESASMLHVCKHTSCGCSLTGSWRLLLLGETGCTKDLVIALDYCSCTYFE